MNPQAPMEDKPSALVHLLKRGLMLAVLAIVFVTVTGADPNRSLLETREVFANAADPVPTAAAQPKATFVRATPETESSPEPTATPNPFPSYAPGELYYEDESMRISIEQHHWEGITYFACEIEIAEASQLKTAFSRDAWNRTEEAVSTMASRHQAVLAVNGDYYSFHRNGIIIREGTLYRANTSTRHLLVVDQQGDLTMITDYRKDPKALANQFLAEGVLQTFEFGPALVLDGEAVPLPERFFLSTGNHEEPRTAIGQIGPLHYLVLVVDGRREGYSRGATLAELQQLFIFHHADMAFNLDGGGSTTLYFNGEVVNLPSAGMERGISDILMFVSGASYEEE